MHHHPCFHFKKSSCFLFMFFFPVIALNYPMLFYMFPEMLAWSMYWAITITTYSANNMAENWIQVYSDPTWYVEINTLQKKTAVIYNNWWLINIIVKSGRRKCWLFLNERWNTGLLTQCTRTFMDMKNWCVREYNWQWAVQRVYNRNTTIERKLQSMHWFWSYQLQNQYFPY